MNITSNNSTTQVMQDQIIQEAFENYVYTLTLMSGLALLFYTNLLALIQEIQYIWLKKFSLPSLFYVLTRYCWLLSQGLNFSLNFVPFENLSICNDIANAGDSVSFLTHIGAQGLLIARAYSLCQGNRILAGLLALGFFSGNILYLFDIIAFSGCQPNQLPQEEGLIVLVTNIINIITECIIFGICWWKVWGTWKLKRETGIQSSNDLVSILLKQIVTRFCFVIVISITSTIINEVITDGLALDIVVSFQSTLSNILIAGFTLDLRQRNAESIEVSNIPVANPLQFRSVLQHIHQSFIMEMADSDDISSEDEAQFVTGENTDTSDAGLSGLKFGHLDDYAWQAQQAQDESVGASA